MKFYINNITHDIERIESALRVLGKLIKVTLPEDMTIRIKHGIPKQLSFLCNVPNIGPKKAWLLYTAGITSPERLKDVKRSTLITCLGAKTADKVLDYINNVRNV